MNHLVRIILIVALAASLAAGFAMASVGKPVAMLIQAKGDVVWSSDGKTWKNVRRNKFLFEGYHVKTGDGASCKLMNQQTNMIEPIGEGAEVEIHAAGTKVVKGDAVKAESAADFMSFLERKFAKVQKYTAVTRKPTRPSQKIKLKTIGNITLSDNHPDLAWENIGLEYTYRLTVGENAYDIENCCESVIRFSVPRQNAGDFAYSVQVLYKGEVIYSPERTGTIHWMSDAEVDTFGKKARKIGEIDPGNGFLVGTLMDEHGLKVAAMDQFQNFLDENPESNEVRPFLIMVLDDLELKSLKEAEEILYHQQ